MSNDTETTTRPDASFRAGAALTRTTYGHNGFINGITVSLEPEVKAHFEAKNEEKKAEGRAWLLSL